MPIHIDNKGVTLIELMIAMVIGSIIMASLIGIISSQRKGYITQQARAEAEESVSRVHGELLDKIRMAGYMIPNTVLAITPYYSATGSDSIRVAGNYDKFAVTAGLTISAGASYFFAYDSDDFKYTKGMKIMLVSPPDEFVDTFWAEVDTFYRFTIFTKKYLQINLKNIIPKTFPIGSRISTFNHYTFRVAQTVSGGDTIKYFAVRPNNQTSLIRLVDGVDDIAISYETRTDTLKMNTFPANSLEFVYAVNLDVQSRSRIKDRTYTDPIYNDHYRRSRLNTQIVILNLALDKR